MLKIVGVAAVFLAWSATTEVRSAIVTYDFSGMIFGLPPTLPPTYFGSDLFGSTTVSGTFSYDTASLPTHDYGQFGVGYQQDFPGALTLQVGPVAVSADAYVLRITNDLDITPEIAGDPLIDEVQVRLAIGEIQLTGDYDPSGSVDFDDLNAWQLGYGSLQAELDGNGDGHVDAADYTIWRDHLGTSAGVTANGIFFDRGMVSLRFQLPEVTFHDTTLPTSIDFASASSPANLTSDARTDEPFGLGVFFQLGAPTLTATISHTIPEPNAVNQGVVALALGITVLRSVR